MKTKLYFFVIAAILFAACSDDDDSILFIDSSDTIHFTSEAKITENVKIKVETNQDSWKVVCDQSWCRIKSGNNSFSVSAKPNDAIAAPQPAKITITAGNATPIYITVTQDGSESYVTVLPKKDVHFSSEAEESEYVTYSVRTNELAWDAVSDQPWCKVTKGSDSFIVSAETHGAIAPPPPATISVTAGDGEPFIINVTQEGADPFITVTPLDAICFSPEADESENITIMIETNELSWNVESDQSWCKVTKSENSFVVSAEPNFEITSPPPAKITITAGSLTPIIINVTQDGVPDDFKETILNGIWNSNYETMDVDLAGTPIPLSEFLSWVPSTMDFSKPMQFDMKLDETPGMVVVKSAMMEERFNLPADGVSISFTDDGYFHYAGRPNTSVYVITEPTPKEDVPYIGDMEGWAQALSLSTHINSLYFTYTDISFEFGAYENGSLPFKAIIKARLVLVGNHQYTALLLSQSSLHRFLTITVNSTLKK